MKNVPDAKTLEKLEKLNQIALNRGQKLSQMAVSWILRDGKVTTVLMGASRPEQITENIQAVFKTDFTDDELKAIDELIK